MGAKAFQGKVDLFEVDFVCTQDGRGWFPLETGQASVFLEVSAGGNHRFEPAVPVGFVDLGLTLSTPTAVGAC
jgi:hypothetical protein